MLGRSKKLSGKRGVDKRKGERTFAVREVRTHKQEKLKMQILYSKSVDILLCKNSLRTLNISKVNIKIYTSLSQLFTVRDLQRDRQNDMKSSVNI